MARGRAATGQQQVEAFPTREIRPHDTALLPDNVVEHNQVFVRVAVGRRQEQVQF